MDAITGNPTDFRGKVVLDVGTGTGILAWFAVRAGAKKVYAVEASGMARWAKKLMDANGVGDIVEVVNGKVEEVDIKEQVDVIISEPMGFMLVHERMLEAFIAARRRFLKPTGKMMPTVGTIFCAPFTDEALHQEQMSKSVFWHRKDFYGLDLTSLAEGAAADHFCQPVVGYLDPNSLISDDRATHTINFQKDTEKDLEVIDIPLAFTVSRTALCHGIATWFDVEFHGTTKRVTLSTSPFSPATHWYQCRLLLRHPIAVNATQKLTGNIHMTVNSKFSYNIELTGE
ncbi:Art4 [Symbiodinium sp. KB8]|nr:Art4 [Symbiodinium sp. KB8]